MILTHIFTDRISFNNINDTCNYFHSSFCGIFYILVIAIVGFIIHWMLGLFLLVVLLVVMIGGGAILSATYSK